MSHQPAWVNDSTGKALADPLRNLLTNVLQQTLQDESSVMLFFDKVAIDDYWRRCFTHYSAEPENNNERLEFYGDKELGCVFAIYLRKRFQGKLDQARLTLANNRYMSKPYQAILAAKLGLDKLLYYDPTVMASRSFFEDVFEAFIGALWFIADDRIYPGLGFIITMNFISDLFKNEQLEMVKDNVTALKELLEQGGERPPSYVQIQSDRPMMVKYQAINRAGDILGIGYGVDKADATKAAAGAALASLEEKGITIESVTLAKQNQRRDYTPAFKEQERRANDALKIAQQIAKDTNRAVPTTFKLVSAPTMTLVGGENKIAATLALGTPNQDGTTIAWVNVSTGTGTGGTEARVNAMKQFADMFGVPP